MLQNPCGLLWKRCKHEALLGALAQSALQNDLIGFIFHMPQFLHGTHTRLMFQKNQRPQTSNTAFFALAAGEREDAIEPASPQRSVFLKVGPKARQNAPPNGGKGRNFRGV
jgi:hypothetical protein